MSLKTRYTHAAGGGGKTKFSCQHYSPTADGKRCAHYIDNGACDREDEFMCVEWLRLNHPDNPLVKKKPRTDLLGVLVPEETPSKTEPEKKPAVPIQVPDRKRERDPPIVRNVNDEEIASFRTLGVSVCIRSEDIGDVWLVPEYTDKDRLELRIDHAATLTAICAAFPGAKVTEYIKEGQRSSTADDD